MKSKNTRTPRTRKIKAVFFDIDDTLYDSTLQSDAARRNAVKAMVEAGLDVDEEYGLRMLHTIVERFGSNYEYHFNELLKKLQRGHNPRIIAAGVIAYHTTKIAYLVPHPDTIPTLLKIRDSGYRIGVITDGRAVKQWEKLVRLGLQHFFHTVVISDETSPHKPDSKLFKKALMEAKVKANEAMMVGDRLDKDILGGNKAGMTTVQILKGKHAGEKPKNTLEEPAYVVSNLRDILRILDIP